MSRELELFRRDQRRISAELLGTSTLRVPLFGSPTTGELSAETFLALPVVPAPQALLDMTTGTQYFVVDVSDFLGEADNHIVMP